MYTRNGIIYSEAGKILRRSRVSGFQLPDNGEAVEEVSINIEGAKLEDNFIIYDRYRLKNHSEFDYAQWKAYIVKMRYSLDDQMAVLLNKDYSEKDLMLYTKMEEWREWASIAAKTFTALNQNT